MLQTNVTGEWLNQNQVEFSFGFKLAYWSYQFYAWSFSRCNLCNQVRCYFVTINSIFCRQRSRGVVELSHVPFVKWLYAHYCLFYRKLTAALEYIKVSEHTENFPEHQYPVQPFSLWCLRVIVYLVGFPPVWEIQVCWSLCLLSM